MKQLTDLCGLQELLEDLGYADTGELFRLDVRVARAVVQDADGGNERKHLFLGGAWLDRDRKGLLRQTSR